MRWTHVLDEYFRDRAVRDHLLTHTSGMADDADEEAGERYEDLWKTRSNYSVVETRDFLPPSVNKPANFPRDKDAAIATAATSFWAS